MPEKKFTEVSKLDHELTALFKIIKMPWYQNEILVSEHIYSFLLREFRSNGMPSDTGLIAGTPIKVVSKNVLNAIEQGVDVVVCNYDSRAKDYFNMDPCTTKVAESLEQIIKKPIKPLIKPKMYQYPSTSL